MLIEFSVANFRSFKEKQTFSMKAETISQHVKSHTCLTGEQNIKGSVLRSAAIFGSNGSGKTSLLLALQNMKLIVIHSVNPSFVLPYIPFKFSVSSRNAPSEFSVTFVEGGVRYQYAFSIGEDRIEKESLMEFAYKRGRLLFVRTYDPQTQDYTWDFGAHLKGNRTLWKESTRPNSLFLSTAIQLNSLQLLPVYVWFHKRLVTIVGYEVLDDAPTIEMLKQELGKNRILSFMKNIGFREVLDVQVKQEQIPTGTALFGHNHLVEQKQGQLPNLMRVMLEHPSDDPNHAHLLLQNESAGMQTMFINAGAWLNVLQNGAVFFIDEIETSLHAELVEFLLEQFHSSSSNAQNAQLIFTTHTTALMDQKLLRRDQIWFCDKDDAGVSHLYSLMEHKPRSDTLLEDKYRQGKYGAIPKIKRGGNIIQNEP